MAKKKSSIKFVQAYKEPQERRDGQMVTHWMRINLTTEEACIMAEMFQRNREHGRPATSLAHAVLLQMATAGNPDEYVNEALTRIKFRAALAEAVADNEVNLALNLLHDYKARKTTVPAPLPPLTQTTQKPAQSQATKPPVPPQPSKMRREYVPEPRRK